MSETNITVQSALPLRAPDRQNYADHPRLHTFPMLNPIALHKRLKASLSLPEILPAHPEAPEPGPR